MSSPRSFFVLALAAFTIASAPSCTPSEDLCTYLDDSLRRCDLPAPRLACSEAEEATKAALVVRVKERGCGGLAAAEDGVEDAAVDPRLCALAGWPCPDSPTPEPTNTAAPVNTVLLVGGIDSSAVFDWHPRIADDLRTRGADVHHVGVAPWASTPVRAADLWRSIKNVRARSGKKVDLICYAVGGIDCRYVASPNGLFASDAAKRAEIDGAIASVTTISTPHRGTRVAEAALSLLSGGSTDDLISALVGADVEVPSDAAILETLTGLTPEAMLAFNREVLDAPGVFYQSFAGTSHVLGRTSNSTERSIASSCADATGTPLLFRHEGQVDAANPILLVTFPFSGTSIGDDGRVVTSPSDGMVSVASAKWGEFRGCLPADHYDVIGQIGHRTRDPLTGFDAVRFYRWVLSDLAARGL